ncbi:14879_t:CDS:2, partial [Cetraspora pellucida]
MKCEKCYFDKLSDEFPFGTISSKCEHVSSWCLKCLVIYLNSEQHTCPICKVKLTEQEINNYYSIWDNASFKVDLESFSHMHTKLPETNIKSGTFYVDDEDKDQSNTLTSYGICENSHIQFIVLLYSISKGQAVNNLVFDLYWGHRNYRSKPDYLDGTCLIYKGNTLWKIYDHRHLTYPDISYIKHSGDVMDTIHATGHHKITAKLGELPDDVTQLYLVLSSWNSPNISHFVNPSFRLYDEENPYKQLCKYNINKANNSRAVIVCLITRSPNGSNWNVFEIGKSSRGTARDYDPIKDKINKIIDLGYKA